MRGQSKSDEMADAKIALEHAKMTKGYWVDAEDANRIMKDRIAEMSDAEIMAEYHKLGMDVVRSARFRLVRATRDCKCTDLAMAQEVIE